MEKTLLKLFDILREQVLVLKKRKEKVLTLSQDRGFKPPMHQYDLVENGPHHEIYLSDPRKVAAEKLKTILRQPVKKR